MNISNELNNIPKTPKGKDKKVIKDFLKENYGNEAWYNNEENMIVLCNNNILSNDKFIGLLTKYKLAIMPSLF